MRCRISDLYVEVPEAGGMAPRCKEYLTTQTAPAQIILDEKQYRYEKLPENPEMVAYLESGFQFYRQLLHFDGMMLHASAVAYRDEVFLFSGRCGAGKSTHARIWQEVFGDAVQIINDDKPALRYVDGTWYAYGTPWCGKDGINCNRKVPVSGICFLKQASENRIRKLDAKEALRLILAQTPHRYTSADDINALLSNVEKLISEIPIYEMENRPEPEAVQLSYETMRQNCREV